MIKILGTRRLLILGVLLGLNAVLALGIYLFMIPMNQKFQGQLSEVTGKVSASKAETERMRTEFDAIQQQKAQFEQLQATDFFTAQDRVQARERFEAIQKFSKVLSASYDIRAAAVENTPELTEAGQVMLTTPVEVKVDALDDLDFYNFVYLIQNAFPGYGGITSLDVTRIKELDDVTLRQIGSRNPAPMVMGQIRFTWKTIVPQKQLAGATPGAGM